MIDAYGKHVLVLEGEQQFRAMLGSVLERQGVSMESAPTREDCLRKLSSRRCDLLIVDTNGYAEPNLEVLSALKHRYPPVPSLVLVDRGDIPTAVRAVKAGAADCLERPLERDRLRSSIETVLGRTQPFVLPAQERLTEIETEVLRQVAAGKTNRDIGNALRRSTRTIEVHRRNLTRKLGTSGIVNLIKRAAAMGLLNATGPLTGRSPTR